MRIVMMGTGTFAEPTFQALLASAHPVVGLITNPDRPSGREREMQRGMKKIALDRGIPIFQPESINAPEGVEGLRAFQPDLLVVAAYGQILSNEVLSLAPRGGINVHASLLPKYRGAAPINWALFHGEERTGVTIIRMSTSLDAGDMLAQDSLEIAQDDTAGTLQTRLAPLGASLALRVLEQIVLATTQAIKQDKSLVTKAPKLTKEHGLIDWSRAARDVSNQIRAMQPWPTAYTFWRRADQPPVRLLVSRVAVIDSLPVSGLELSPGMLLQGPELALRMLIATGSSSAVEILELQPSGKRSMAAADFLRGHAPRPGDRLGSESP